MLEALPKLAQSTTPASALTSSCPVKQPGPGAAAGLAATAYLSRAGQKVLLIEKNPEFGGLVSTFSHNGFHFDAGVRALEDAG